MSTITGTLEMERGQRKRITITGLDRRRQFVDLEALILSVAGAPVVRIEEETDPAFPDSFIVTALDVGECDLQLECDARPGEGSVALADRRHVVVRSPDAIATKWNEVDLPDLPADGEASAGEQPTGEQPTGEQPTGEQPTGEQPTGAFADDNLGTEPLPNPPGLWSFGTVRDANGLPTGELRPSAIALRGALEELLAIREDGSAIINDWFAFVSTGDPQFLTLGVVFNSLINAARAARQPGEHLTDEQIRVLKLVLDPSLGGATSGATEVDGATRYGSADYADAAFTQPVWVAMLAPHVSTILAHWDAGQAAIAQQNQ